MKKLFLFFPLLLVYLPTTSADGSTEAQPKKTNLDERFNTPISKPKAVKPKNPLASTDRLFSIIQSLQESERTVASNIPEQARKKQKKSSAEVLLDQIRTAERRYLCSNSEQARKKHWIYVRIRKSKISEHYFIFVHV